MLLETRTYRYDDLGLCFLLIHDGLYREMNLPDEFKVKFSSRLFAQRATCLGKECESRTACPAHSHWQFGKDYLYSWLDSKWNLQGRGCMYQSSLKDTEPNRWLWTELTSNEKEETKRKDDPWQNKTKPGLVSVDLLLHNNGYQYDREEW